ncbi:hypothetical protein CN946_14070 [Bacillus sp. AFS053548]|nr:hypothetical protein CN946_14070 [Bacillus sp. AFS053548]
MFKKCIGYKILQLYFGSDWNVRCETPVGKEGRVRPRRRAEEAHLSPHGKGVSWRGNQRSTYFIRTDNGIKWLFRQL